VVLNRFPLWKNLLVVGVLLVGLLFALPNMFGEAPAVQVSAQTGQPLDETALQRVGGVLDARGIPHGRPQADEPGSRPARRRALPVRGGHGRGDRPGAAIATRRISAHAARRAHPLQAPCAATATRARHAQQRRGPAGRAEGHPALDDELQVSAGTDGERFRAVPDA
jgi:hypothetical protein